MQRVRVILSLASIAVGAEHAREILRGNDHLLPHVNNLLAFVEGMAEGRHGRSRESGRMAA